MNKKSLLFVFVASFSLCAAAQTPGAYPFAPIDSYGVDSVNRGTLDLQLSIPIISKPGRGGSGFSYSLLYDGLIWSSAGPYGSAGWSPSANWGWIDSTNVVYGYITYDRGQDTCTVPPRGYEGYQTTLSNYVYHDSHGSTFSIPYSFTGTCNGSGVPTGSGTYSLGGNSGYTVVRSGSTFRVYTREGASAGQRLVINPPDGTPPNVPFGSTVYSDTNGNSITASSSGAFTDTTGHTVVSKSGSGTPASPEVFTYIDSNGSSQTVTVSYTAYTVATNFGVSGVPEFPPTSEALISSIAYSADSSAYYFSYEPTPGYSGDVTGRLASVTLRTGGTISYAYTGANNGIQPDGTLSGLTRTTSDGSIAYSRSGITSTSSTTQRLDADSNATVSQFQISGGYFFETDQATYTGPASGTPLMEAQTCFNEYSSVGCTITSGVVESVNTAYLANGTTYDNTSSQYNSVGLMTAATNQHGTLEYSYTTLTNASGGAMYRLSGVSMNGTTMFTYGYDETTPIATSGLPSHGTVTGSRGNQTSAHAWYSSSAHLDATTTYDDAGQVLAQTDWNGNTTSYQYDSATDALLTQTTLPNGLYSTTVFDPNTGLQTSGTDLTHTNTTTYSYDGLLRPLTVAAPDGGTTTYSYASPTQTQVSVLRGGTSYNVQTSVVDGYGRTSTITQTDAESGNETATTTYDESGRVHSVTNPHRSSSSSTDGTTTYAYDAAGRAVTVTEPDTSQVTYNYTAAAGYVTVTDEQGNQRKLGYESAGAANGTVYEPDASGAMTLLTQSTLDATGHVTAVSQQGGATSSSQYRNRSFVYDSAERLTSETTPEQGTITYTYVNGGGGLCSGNLTAP